MGALNLESMIVVEDLISQISDEYIERIGAGMSPKSAEEAVVGVIESLSTKRLWAAKIYHQARANQMLSQGQMMSNEVEAKSQFHEARRLTALSEFCGEVFWIQARYDTQLWKDCNIGMRQGWELVTSPNSLDILNRIMGGGR